MSIINLEESLSELLVKHANSAEHCWAIAFQCANNAVMQQMEFDRDYTLNNPDLYQELGIDPYNPNQEQSDSANMLREHYKHQQIYQLALGYLSLLNRKGLVGL